jgi:hypothetical protein
LNVLPHSRDPKILRRTKTRTKASKPRYFNNAPQISFYVILAGPKSFFDLPGCGTTVLDPADNLKMSPVGRQMIKHPCKRLRRVIKERMRGMETEFINMDIYGNFLSGDLSTPMFEYKYSWQLDSVSTHLALVFI